MLWISMVAESMPTCSGMHCEPFRGIGLDKWRWKLRLGRYQGV